GRPGVGLASWRGEGRRAQLVLAGEVLVDRAGRGSAGRGDVGALRGEVTGPAEQLPCRVQQRGARLGRPDLSAGGPRLRHVVLHGLLTDASVSEQTFTESSFSESLFREAPCERS